MSDSAKHRVTERTPKDGPEEGYRVDVPVPDETEKDTYVKHYVLPDVEGETDQANDMIDSALRLGLRPVGNPRRVSEKPHATSDTSKVITWSVKVEVPEGREEVLAPRDDAKLDPTKKD